MTVEPTERRCEVNTMNMPGFTAEASLYKTRGHYQADRSRGPYRHAQPADSHGPLVVPAGTCEECEMDADVREWHCYDNVPPGPLQATCIANSNRVLVMCLRHCDRNPAERAALLKA
jgi:hypothetical protein